MPLSHSERGRLGADLVNERMTPEQRKERAQKAYLTGAVRTVLARRPQLTPEQVALLRAEFGGR